jgi:hypothetical protein
LLLRDVAGIYAWHDISEWPEEARVPADLRGELFLFWACSSLVYIVSTMGVILLDWDYLDERGIYCLFGDAGCVYEDRVDICRRLIMEDKWDK